MKVVIQKVRDAKCIVDNKVVGEIDYGFLLLVGFTIDDNIDIIKKIAKKIANLRIFEDEVGLINKSLKDVNGSILSISQFTLYADCKKGNRPSFTKSLNADDAKNLYELFNLELKSYEYIVETGIFQAHMNLDFVNEGPITIILDSRDL